jgi:hypothetical protein
LPRELEKVDSAEKLHRALKNHLPKPASRRGKKK